MVCGYADGSTSRSASAACVTQPAHGLTRGKRAASRTVTRAPARASRHATVLPPGPPPTTRTSAAVIRAAAPPARRAGRRAARAGARSRSQRAWPRRCRPRCRARRRCMPRRNGATWAGGRYAGTRRASGTRPRSRSRPSCPRTCSSRPRDGRRAGPRGRRRRAGGARPPPLRADPGAPRPCPPSSAPAASREAPFKRPRARAIVRRVSAAPVTLEGWYVLHSMYAVDWPRWNALGAAERDAMVAEATALLERQSAPADGHSGCWTLLGHKGDLCLMHWRRDLEALRAEEVALARTRLRAFLVATYSYLSVIELGTYELAGHAEARLAARGVRPDPAQLEEEVRRLAAPPPFPESPPRRQLSLYPLFERRGEQVNWYDLPPETRAELMRGHGEIGRKYAGRVTQVIAGSAGLDDWESGVTLVADDPLVSKKLEHEMRVYPASSTYAPSAL